MSDDEKDDPNYQDWWDDDNIPVETRRQWQSGLDRYLTYQGNMKVTAIQKFDIALAKRVIEHVATENPLWKDFPPTSFNSGRYMAHLALYQALRNRYLALKKIAEEEAKQKEQKKTQAQ